MSKNMTGKIRSASLVAGLLTISTACPRRQAPPPPVPPASLDSIARERERVRQDSISRADAARRDSIARVQAEADRVRAESERAIAATRASVTSPIYFEYDSDLLSVEATANLEAKLAILNANTGLRVRVAGHTDERGSDEYNLALGQRRAAAAKRFLTQRGVRDDRIEVVSFGEERPEVTGGDESAWSRNRRDEFEIVAGGDALVAPVAR